MRIIDGGIIPTHGELLPDAATLVHNKFLQAVTKMIRSMTSFARESTATTGSTITVELRSVNHRYLDCSFKLPESLRALEPKLREQLSKSLARGKVECLVRLQSQASEGELIVDQKRLSALLDALHSVEKHVENAEPPKPLELLQFPGIYHAPEQSEDALQDETLKLFTGALENMQLAREREGDKLAQMIQERLDKLVIEVGATREAIPELIKAQRDRVISRLNELQAEVDQSRLEQELVYLAQKSDVDEELDRLGTHVTEVRRTLKKGGPCGRRLDFLMQELNREANTLSSKSLSSSTTLNAVELKVLIEQMREQIQNIE